MNNPHGTPSTTTTQTATPEQPAAPIPHYLDMHAAARPDKPALICGDHALTYAELNKRANRVANALSQLGVQARDRVAVMAYNSIEAIEISAGLGKLFATPVQLNYRLQPREVAYVVNDSQAKVVIAGAGLVRVVEQARAEVQGERVYIAIGDEVPVGWLRYEELLAAASEQFSGGANVVSATMSYTSGTTGNPKGAYRPAGVPAQDLLPIIMAFALSDNDVYLLAGPYYHSAPNFYVNIYLVMGATIVVQPKFDPVEALRLIDTHKITSSFMAPTLLQRICDVPEEIAAQYDTSSLRAIILGAAPCPFALKVRAIERLGQCLWEFYGATETGFVTILRPEDQLRKAGSCGQIAPGQEILLLDETGSPVPDGTPGEMWSRNSWLAEYFNKPEATAKSMRNGFFSVGDIAYRDDEGFYFICDRKIDMIISGGVNIYPAEIEAVLAAHPAVADVAVIGIPDTHWGESVKAVVALRPGKHVTSDELIAFCAANLADYKKPRSIDFVDELPRSPSGKLLKKEIRAPYWAGTGRKI